MTQAPQRAPERGPPRDRASEIVEDARHADHAARMRQAGVDVDGLTRDGQLSVRRWEDAYLQDGRFDHERMLAMLEGALADRRSLGSPSCAPWATWNEC